MMATTRVLSGGNLGKNKGGAYVDRDKPAQIRFSNISAGKGKHSNVPFLGFISKRVYL